MYNKEGGNDGTGEESLPMLPASLFRQKPYQYDCMLSAESSKLGRY
jgi:hypothetical protein